MCAVWTECAHPRWWWNVCTKHSLKCWIFKAAGWLLLMCLSMSLCFAPQVQSHGSQGSPPSLLLSLPPHTQTYPSISRPSLSSCPPSVLPSPPVLIMQLFSFSPGGGLPWTNIVPYASFSGGPYCVWRNGELTPMSEPSQWGHCVWIFLRLTQSHPMSLPCTGQAGGDSWCPPLLLIIWWKHAYNSKLKSAPKLDALTRYFLCLINFPANHTERKCLSCWFSQTEMQASGCTVTEGGPCNSFFLVGKNKETHKGLYCISMITGFRILLVYLQGKTHKLCIKTVRCSLFYSCWSLDM